MSFFKNIFKKSTQQPRKLENINQLLINDIIVFTDSFALPTSLRSQQFQIKAINSYEFENNIQTEWALLGANNHELFLSLEIDDTTELKISLKIEHEDVESLFDLESFSEIFEQPGNAFLEMKADTDKTINWTCNQYQQSIFAKVGFFHRKDHRTQALSAYEGKDSGEQFELYRLYNKDQSKGIDIEVWQDGDTEVCLTLYRPLSDIIDMYPAS
jgi:Holliday junction resolvase